MCIRDRREQINYYSELYYEKDDPAISDYEFDKLMHQLIDIEEEYPQLLTPDSPTHRVGGRASNSFEQVEPVSYTHLVWSFVVSFLAVSALSPIITVILIVIGLISLLIPQILGKGLTRQQEEYSARRGEYIARVKDILDGFLTIKNCHRFDYFEKQHQKINVQTEESGRKNSSKMYFATWISIPVSYTHLAWLSSQ